MIKRNGEVEKPRFSTRCRRGLGARTIVWNAKKHLKTSIGTRVNQNTLVACVRKRLACTNHSFRTVHEHFHED